MSDEIKEILDKAKEISGYGSDGKQHTRMFNQFEAKALLDYITNLQEENENKTEYICDLVTEKINYKSRNEKALDKLYCYGEVFDSKILQQFQKEMENVLQGEDKDVKD